MKKFLLGFIALGLLFSLAACGGKNASSDSGITINVGAQTYTDPKLMAQMVKALVENQTNDKVKITSDIQSSPQIITAMSQGQIDVATLYSGEVYNNHFDKSKVHFTTDKQKTIQQAQKLFDEKYNIKWFDTLGFDNEYSITVPNDWAKAHNVTTISDLKKYANQITLGADSSWLQRTNDGYPAFKKKYGFKFKNAKGMAVALMYPAIKNNNVQAITAYTVDPQIIQLNLRILKDDKSFFPPYSASLVAREALLKKHPEVEKVIKELTGKISNKEMTQLIYQVNIKKQDPKDVAVAFLKKKGLLKGVN